MTKVYTIIAGVNGAGKTSLYNVIGKTGELGERVNIDEMVMASGSWKDAILQLKESREAMRLIDEYIEKGKSFHLETTLPGTVICRQAKKAKAKGFTVELYFVGIEDIEVAIERVHKRVENGGHGIEDSVIRKRYEKIWQNLTELLPLCDYTVFYDNSDKFSQVAIMTNNRFLDCDANPPAWFKKAMEMYYTKVQRN